MLISVTLTLIWRHTFTLVASDVVRLEVCVNRVVLKGPHHLLYSIRDKDKGDEAGEALFSETCYVLDDVASVRGHQDKTLKAGVQSNPQAQIHVVNVISPDCEKNEVIYQKISILPTDIRLFVTTPGFNGCYPITNWKR